MTLAGTLSLVMTSWAGTSKVMVRRSTRTTRSTMGMMRKSPGPLAGISRPSRKITPRWYSGKTLMAADRMMKTTARRPATATIHDVSSRAVSSFASASDRVLRTRSESPSTLSTSTAVPLRDTPFLRLGPPHLSLHPDLARRRELRAGHSLGTHQRLLPVAGPGLAGTGHPADDHHEEGQRREGGERHHRPVRPGGRGWGHRTAEARPAPGPPPPRCPADRHSGS